MSVKITKVLLLDNVDPAAKEILEKNGVQAELCKDKFSGDTLITKLQAFDAVVVRSATKVTAQVIENCPNLKIIGRAGVGVDNIDVKAATRNGVVVMNTPGGNTISAAEHTCTLICCLSRNVPAADAHVKSGKWDRKAFMGHELYGKTLGIIGLGRIGLEVALRMQSFGMKTIGYDPIVSADVAEQHNVEWLELEKLWPQVDYITVHTPLIPQTKGLVNAKVFQDCKPGVRIINCARGGIIDEDDLLAALESGACGGAGLDVFVEEPVTNTKLASHPKVVACPHLGASTKEGQARCGREMAEQFVDFSHGKSFFGVINAPALAAAASAEGSAWCQLATGLGKVSMNYAKGAANYSVSVSTAGCSLEKMGRAVKAAVCEGLVKSPKANLVNSVALAEDRGIQVSVGHKNAKANCMSLKVISEGGEFNLDGSVFDGKPAITAVDGELLSSPLVIGDKLLLCKTSCSQSKIGEVVCKLSAQQVAVKAMSATSIWIVFVTNTAFDSTVLQGTVDTVVQA